MTSRPLTEEEFQAVVERRVLARVRPFVGVQATEANRRAMLDAVSEVYQELLDESIEGLHASLEAAKAEHERDQRRKIAIPFCTVCWNDYANKISCEPRVGMTMFLQYEPTPYVIVAVRELRPLGDVFYRIDMHRRGSGTQLYVIHASVLQKGQKWSM